MAETPTQKVELTPAECQNIKTALIMTAKRPDVNENTMKALLILAEKFDQKPNKDK